MYRMLLAALAVICFAPGFSVAAPIIYTLDDYPTLQGGYHISGTITTDGTLGPITIANVQSWSFTIKDPSGATQAGGSSPPLPLANLNPFQNVTATATSLNLPFFAGVGGGSDVIFTDASGLGTLEEAVNANAFFSNGSSDTPAVPGFPQFGGTSLWSTDTAIPNAPFEIAHVVPLQAPSSVPEPATLTLMLVGIGGLLGARQLRRRAAASRSTE